MTLSKNTIVTVVCIVGSLITIGALFLNWMTVEATLSDSATQTISLTGWDIHNSDGINQVMEGSIVPLMVLMMGIFSLIISIMPCVSKKIGWNWTVIAFAVIAATTIVLLESIGSNTAYLNDSIIPGLNADPVPQWITDQFTPDIERASVSFSSIRLLAFLGTLICLFGAGIGVRCESKE